LDVDRERYLQSLVHHWSRILAMLVFALVPLFFILDYFMMPAELLTRFAIYRLTAVGIVAVQFVILKLTRPSRASAVHGYVLTLAVGGVIALMTTDLGGFNSTYYAGLNLVLIAVAVLLPWGTAHSAAIAVLTVAMYVGANFLFPSPEPLQLPFLLNNLYFLIGTAVIAVSINYVKQLSINQEFLARTQLKEARDALWGEMEVAKRIQTSLLPRVLRVPGYSVGALMLPAEEVGGDYYDIIATPGGPTWVAIGDVSGHGVESGLIMMMAQTSIATTVAVAPGVTPAAVLARVNGVLEQNMERLEADRYMTICLLLLQDDRVTFAGRHQDLLVFRRAERTVERIATEGTWLGIAPDIDGHVTDQSLALGPGDAVLLFTDGVTEAMDKNGQLWGQERLELALARYAHLEVEEIVRNLAREVQQHTDRQDDDVTLVVLRRDAG
jgi:serine phosphatase RsbU (regulator of sigma subunit)